MESQEWTANPEEELLIPPAYITNLKYEILILSSKKTFTFRCIDYERDKRDAFVFHNVIMDTSTRNARGVITLQRVSYHDKVTLCNTGFMVIPIPKTDAEVSP